MWAVFCPLQPLSVALVWVLHRLWFLSAAVFPQEMPPAPARAPLQAAVWICSVLAARESSTATLRDVPHTFPLTPGTFLTLFPSLLCGFCPSPRCCGLAEGSPHRAPTALSVWACLGTQTPKDKHFYRDVPAVLHL